MLLEHSLKVRLIGKAQFISHIDNQAACLEPGPGVLDAQVNQIGMRRHVIALFEGADQVGAGQVRGAAHVVQADGVLEIVMDELRDPFNTLDCLLRPDR